jgi:serine protease Do
MNTLHRLRNALFAVIAVAVVPAVSACSSGASNEPLSLAATPPTTAPDSTPTPQLESELGETPAVPVELQVLAAQEALLTGIYDRIVPSVVRIVTSPGTLGASEGSGFVWDDRGHIVTNYHVVRGGGVMRALFFSGDEYDATVVGSDPDADIAVIKIDAPAEKLIPIELGDSSGLRPGQFTIAIGAPFGQDFTMTGGIISAVGRLIDSGFSQFAIPEVIQTDAAINPGNSGGALVNIRGELVGINTAIATRSGSYQGIGFAIPINMAQRVMAALIEHGEVVRGWLGVMIQDIGEDLAQVLELSNRQGALVGEVVEDSPASEAGVEEGDVILEFDGSSVEDTNDLRNRVAATSPGKRAKLGVLRDGNRRTLTVAIGQLPAEYGGTQPRQPESRLGLVAQELTPDLAKLFRYKGKEGVLVSSVASGSPADDAGLRPGDIIREIDRATVEDVETYERLIREAEPGDTLLLLVRRTSGQLYLTLSVPEE